MKLLQKGKCLTFHPALYKAKIMRTSIYWASYRGYTDIVQYLLQSNADPNIPNNVSVLLY